MDGLSRVAGGLIDVTLAGKSYLLRPLTLRDFATVEFHLLARRHHPVEAARHLLPALAGSPEVARDLVERGAADLRRDRGFVRRPWDEVFAWINTDEGVNYTAWLCLYREHPARFAALEDVAGLLGKASAEERAELVRRRDLIAGLDHTAAADWPAPKPGAKGGDAKDYFSPWKATAVQLLRDILLGSDFGSFGDLTLYQLRLARSREGDRSGVQTMSLAEYRAWQVARAEVDR